MTAGKRLTTEAQSAESGFLWGVATSAYQSEGGYNITGGPRTNWADAEEKRDVAVTGGAAEFWTRYESDFAYCKKLGLSAFRLGIEWSRIQPGERSSAGDPPPFDYSALDHYAQMLVSCRAHGMEPVLTLHHFVHPAWLGSDPWLNHETPELFRNYVRASVQYLNCKITELGGQPVHYFITINEPNMLVLNTYLGNQFPSRSRLGPRSVITAYNHLLIAHLLAYNELHDLYEMQNWPRPMVTLNNYCSDLYWSDKVLLDLLCIRERGIGKDQLRSYIESKRVEFETAFEEARIPLHKDIPYYFGALMKRISNWIGRRWFQPSQFDPLIRAIEQSPRARLFDYIGLDYYDPFAAHAFRLPVLWDHEFKNKSVRSWVMNTITSKWWDWRVLPRGLHFFCRYYSNDFAKRQVLIAENGMAIRRRLDNSHTGRRDKITRSQFLRLHVHEVTKIVNEGIPLIGYLHWSLFDNYEWGSYTPRFGLLSIDYTKGADRLLCDHTGDNPSETYASLIQEANSKMKAPLRLSGDD
jgi:beta-glucosidase